MVERAVAVRFTTTPKPTLRSIVEVPATEEVPGGRILCRDIYDVYDDEVKADIGALSPLTMAGVNNGLKAALSLC